MPRPRLSVAREGEHQCQLHRSRVASFPAAKMAGGGALAMSGLLMPLRWVNGVWAYGAADQTRRVVTSHA
jgi:hypothetical protein